MTTVTVIVVKALAGLEVSRMPFLAGRRVASSDTLEHPENGL